MPARLADACELALAKTRPSGLPRPLPWPSACAPHLPGLGRPFRERRGANHAAAHGEASGSGRRQRLAESTRVIAAAPAGSSIATTVKVGADRAVWRRHRRRTARLLVGALVVVLAALTVMELRSGDHAAPAPAATATPAAPQVTVTLQATAIVWTRIGVDGRTAYEGTLTAGTRRTFTGRRVIDLHLGNAGGVQLTVNGSPRALPGAPGQVWRGRFVPTPRRALAANGPPPHFQRRVGPPSKLAASAARLEFATCCLGR